MSGWLRLYEQVLDDPKVQSLPAETFKHWINILCLAKRNDGVLPSLSDIAFSLRISASSADKLLKTLVDRRLIDVNGDNLIPHNWNGRQYKSDVSTERVKRFRKRNETVTVTPPETETETETEKPIVVEKQKSTRFTPPSVHEVTAYCSERKNSVNPQQFVDHYTSNGWKVGKNPMKDWRAAIRTWERNSGTTTTPSHSEMMRGL